MEKEKTTFKTGDIVRLKSGGPDMTVKGYVLGDETSVICQWFAGRELDKLESGHFPEDSLEVRADKAW